MFFPKEKTLDLHLPVQVMGERHISEGNIRVSREAGHNTQQNNRGAVIHLPLEKT